MSLWKATFDVPYEAADIFSDILEEAFVPEALAVSTSEAAGSNAPLVKTASDWNEVEAHGLWTLEALYEEAPDEARLRALLKSAEETTGASIGKITIAPL